VDPSPVEHKFDALTTPRLNQSQFWYLICLFIYLVVCFYCQYMTQIREKQEQREAGTWPSLPATQRAEAENGYRHMSMLARFHNIMGNETIHTLEMITTEIRSIFTNAVMVDRIAAMLNYFLLHLVSNLVFLSFFTGHTSLNRHSSFGSYLLGVEDLKKITNSSM